MSKVHLLAARRTCRWLNFLRNILSFSIPNRFHPGTLRPRFTRPLVFGTSRHELTRERLLLVAIESISRDTV